jgi:hypothetical protein
VLSIPGRQYNVQVVHSEANHEKDYVAAAVDTALDIHLQQPPGDILLFLTGQAEIEKARLAFSIKVCSLRPVRTMPLKKGRTNQRMQQEKGMAHTSPPIWPHRWDSEMCDC